MQKIKRQLNKLNKIAIICLSFVILFTVSFFGLKTVLASWEEPTSAPPVGNSPLLIDIGETPQAKEGYLKIDPHFNILGDIPTVTHALEVADLGALINDKLDVTKNMSVDPNSGGSERTTLLVNNENNKVGIGTNDLYETLTIRTFGTTSEDGLFAGIDDFPIPKIAVAGYSSDNTGILGSTSVTNYSAIYGISTFAGANSYGVWGNGKGIGVYGLSVNGVGLWAENNSVDDAALFGRSLSDPVFLWSNVINLSNSANIKSRLPALAFDTGNHPHIIWAERLSDEEIYYSYCRESNCEKSTAWSIPLDISNIPGSNDEYSSIAIDSQDIVHVIWSNQFNIYYTKCISNCGEITSWSSPVNITISEPIKKFDNPYLVIDKQDRLHLVSHNRTNIIPPYLEEIFYSICSANCDNIDSWSTPLNISQTSGESVITTIFTDSYNNPHVAWYDNTPGNNDIYYTFYNGTTWQQPAVNISNTTENSVSPNLVLNSDNQPHVVWQEGPYPNEIYYSKCESNCMNSSSWIKENISNTSNSSIIPSMAFDQRDLPHVAWSEEITPGWADYQLYHKFWNGSQWVIKGNIGSGLGLSGCGYSRMKIDSANGIHIAFNCPEYDPASEIYYSVGDPYYNASQTFAGYFQGRLGAINDEIIGTKFLPTKLQNSLIPYASGFKIGDYNVAASPNDIIFDGTYIWVAKGAPPNNLLKIRAADGVEVNHYDINGGASNLLFDGSNIWVTNGINNKLTKLTISDGNITSYFLLQGAGAKNKGMAFDGTDLWVTNELGNNVSRFRISEGKEFNCNGTDPGGAATPCPVGDGPSNIIYDGKYLWVANNNGDSVSQLWGNIGTVAKTIGLGVGNHPTDLVFDGTYVWVTFDHATEADKISKIRAEDGEEIGKFPIDTELINPSSLTFDGTYLWVANSGENTVSKIRVADSKELNCDGTEPTGNPVRCQVGNDPSARPQSILFDGTYIWTANQNSDNLTKLYSGTGWGHTDLALVINLHPDNMSNDQQTGSFQISGSGVIGKNLEVGGNLTADSNVWGAETAEDIENNEWTKTGSPTGVDVVFELMQARNGDLYAATMLSSNKGNVFKSTDGGETWASTDSTNVLSSVTGGVESLLQTTDGTIFAGVWAGAPNIDIYKYDKPNNKWDPVVDLFHPPDDYPDVVFDLIQARDGTIYAGTNEVGAIFKSTDGGTTWEYAGAAGYEVNKLLETADGIIYAGVYGGGPPEGEVYKSEDKGVTWTETGELANAGSVNDLIQAADGTIYAGTGYRGDVFKTEDGGLTWVNTGNIPNEETGEIYSLYQTSTGTIYAGGEHSRVYRYDKKNNTWLATILPGAWVVYTFLETTDRTLYAGTEGSGYIFKLDFGVCPNGHFLKGITTDEAGELWQIKCRGL